MRLGIMREKYGKIKLAAVLMLGLLAVWLWMFLLRQYPNRNAAGGVTEAVGTGVVTETGVRAAEQVEEIGRSYIEKYGLEYVDKPEKRNDEQILQKLAELAEEHDLIRKIYNQAEHYSMEMLEHLANNPEMAAYVIASPEREGRTFGTYTEEELEETYPLLLQFDPRWGYFEYGGKAMGLSGCGPTCLAMAILALTDYQDMTPDKIAEYSMEKDYYVEDVGTAWKLMDELPKLCGLTVAHPTLREESMKAVLDDGKVLICSVKKGVFTADGHFIVIYGYDESGFKVNDPQCVARSRKTWQFSEFGKQLKRIWAIGAENQKNG